jgi:DNA-binding GntR family transcriptional regulator
MRVRGSQTTHKLLDMRIIPAEGKVAENLALPEGSLIVFLQRQRLVDGDVAGYEIRHLPRHSGQAFTQDEIHNHPLVQAVGASWDGRASASACG